MVIFSALRLSPKLHTHLWDPSEALLNFDYVPQAFYLSKGEFLEELTVSIPFFERSLNYIIGYRYFNLLTTSGTYFNHENAEGRGMKPFMVNFSSKSENVAGFFLPF